MVKGNIVKVIYAKESERRKRGMDIKVDNVSGRQERRRRDSREGVEKRGGGGGR